CAWGHSRRSAVDRRRSRPGSCRPRIWYSDRRQGRGAVSARTQVHFRLPVGARMLRRIAVIIAAALLWCGLLAAHAAGTGKSPPGGGTPARTAALETTTPVDRAPAVQRERAEQAAKDSIRSLDLQTDLTLDTSKPFRVSPIHIPQEVLWVALALAAALLLYAMRDQLMNLFRPARTGWEPPPPAAGEVKIGSETDALAAADRLSREGNFVEAMHVLLLHSLSEIRRQLGER